MSEMISDEELDLFIEEDLKKDIDQTDSIDHEDVEKKLGEMGWLWNAVQAKFIKDKKCFNCKREIDFSKETMNVLEATKVEDGAIAFVAVCPECYSELEKKQKKEKKEE